MSSKSASKTKISRVNIDGSRFSLDGVIAEMIIEVDQPPPTDDDVIHSDSYLNQPSGKDTKDDNPKSKDKSSLDDSSADDSSELDSDITASAEEQMPLPITDIFIKQEREDEEEYEDTDAIEINRANTVSKKKGSRSKSEIENLKESQRPIFFDERVGYGKGVKLGSISEICDRIRNKRTGLRSLFRIIYYRWPPENINDAIYQLLQFNGFPFDNTSFEYVKRQRVLKTFNDVTLRHICYILGIKPGSKSKMFDCILSFLMKPSREKDTYSKRNTGKQVFVKIVKLSDDEVKKRLNRTHVNVIEDKRVKGTRDRDNNEELGIFRQTRLKRGREEDKNELETSRQTRLQRAQQQASSPSINTRRGYSGKKLVDEEPNAKIPKTQTEIQMKASSPSINSGSTRKSIVGKKPDSKIDKTQAEMQKRGYKPLQREMEIKTRLDAKQMMEKREGSRVLDKANNVTSKSVKPSEDNVSKESKIQRNMKAKSNIKQLTEKHEVNVINKTSIASTSKEYNDHSIHKKKKFHQKEMNAKSVTKQLSEKQKESKILKKTNDADKSSKEHNDNSVNKHSTKQSDGESFKNNTEVKERVAEYKVTSESLESPNSSKVEAESSPHRKRKPGRPPKRKKSEKLSLAKNYKKYISHKSHKSGKRKGHRSLKEKNAVNINADENSAISGKERDVRLADKHQRQYDEWVTEFLADDPTEIGKGDNAAAVNETGENKAKGNETDENKAKGNLPKTSQKPQPIGKKLELFPQIKSSIDTSSSNMLQRLHVILYGTSGQPETMKRNILRFDGFKFKPGSEEWDQKEFLLSLVSMNMLREYMEVLHLVSTGDGPTTLIQTLMDFLSAPNGSMLDEDVPQPTSKKKKEQEVKKGPRHRKCLMDEKQVRKLELEIAREERAKRRASLQPTNIFATSYQKNTVQTTLQTVQTNQNRTQIQQPSSLVQQFPSPGYGVQLGGNAHAQTNQMRTQIQQPNSLIQRFPYPGYKVKLGDNAHVQFMVVTLNYADLEILHNIIYLRDAPKSRIRRNILDFNGFSFDENSEKYKVRLTILHKLGYDIVKRISFILGLTTMSTDLPENDLCTIIMQFLVRPTLIKQVPLQISPASFFQNAPQGFNRCEIFKDVPPSVILSDEILAASPRFMVKDVSPRQTVTRGVEELRNEAKELEEKDLTSHEDEGGIAIAEVITSDSVKISENVSIVTKKRPIQKKFPLQVPTSNINMTLPILKPKPSEASNRTLYVPIGATGNININMTNATSPIVLPEASSGNTVCIPISATSNVNMNPNDAANPAVLAFVRTPTQPPPLRQVVPRGNTTVTLRYPLPASKIPYKPPTTPHAEEFVVHRRTPAGEDQKFTFIRLPPDHPLVPVLKEGKLNCPLRIEPLQHSEPKADVMSSTSGACEASEPRPAVHFIQNTPVSSLSQKSSEVITSDMPEQPEPTLPPAVQEMATISQPPLDDEATLSGDENVDEINASYYPGDDEIFEKVRDIIHESDLEDVTIRNVVCKVKVAYPHLDVKDKYEFIKEAVKNILRGITSPHTS